MHFQFVAKCKHVNECKFGPQKCWFIHQENIEIAYEQAKNGKKIDNLSILNCTLNTIN